ncbi:MAG TPA: DUF4384 domain-containing protein, partial [Longimicrobiaceae bacterium]|nr:DUF4384 domain-containing protein [Longimicrobiaceae bacterium]
MNARTLLTAAFFGIATLTPPARAQVLPPAQGTITVFLPAEWTGHGVRDLRGPGGITFQGETVLVEGLAYHPLGIERVSVGGNPAVLLADPNGGTRFRAYLPTADTRHDVEIVAYPVEGTPLVRVQHPDGRYDVRLGSADGPAPLPLPLQFLPLYAGDLPADAQPAITTQLAAIPGALLVPEAATARLSLGRTPQGEYQLIGGDGSVRSRAADARELARAISREVDAFQLEALPYAPGPFELDFQFRAGNTFRLGEGIEFRVRTARDGYLTVVDLGTDGTLGVLFPVLDDNALIRAGQELILPTREARSFFAPLPPYRATAPTGVGLVRAFVTPSRVVLPPS